MIHEFGHYIVAKLMGVRVNEFAIGMGPKLLKKRVGETEYTLRALPFGGFCAMEGEDEGAPAPTALGGNAGREPDPAAAGDKSRAFGSKKVWQRILIVVAGVTMNLLLGYVLLLADCAFLQEPYDDKGTVLFGTTTIARLAETSPAYQSGLRAGDTVLSVNGRRMVLDSDLLIEMQSDPDGILEMTVRRTVDGKPTTLTLDAVEFERLTDEKTGQNYLKYDFYILGVPRTFGNTFTQAAKEELSMATLVWRSLADIVRGRYHLNDLSGPVGTVGIIADVVGDATSQRGLEQLVYLLSLLTINLGVMNLLPFPGLDGGRLCFLVFEGITRRRIPPKWEGIVNLVGLALLMLLMLVITYSDIFKLFV